MSWNGAIPVRKLRFKGLRNKRSKKSPKAIAAKLAKRMQLANSRRRGFDGRGDGGEESW